MNTSLEDMPVISVIVPVYNTAPWLPRCLDSICAQTYRNLEILCVNDGSTDNSAEILEEYAAKDSRIKVFAQENAGLSAARNTALERATGEWVTGVDSDDYLEAGAYKRAMCCCSSDIDMVFFGVQNVAEDGRLLPREPYFDLPKAGVYEMTPSFAQKLNVCFCTKLWRRSLLEAHALRFPIGLLHEDTALYYLYVPYVRKIACSPERGYMYMQRGGSIMHAAHDTKLAMARRYVKVAFFLMKRYAELDLLRGKNSRLYFVNMLAHLCTWFRYMDSEAEQVEAEMLLLDMVRKSALWRENYCMERLVPVEWWKRPFLSRYERARVWCFLCIPVYLEQYDEFGNRVSGNLILWNTLRRVFRKLNGSD